jgi:hypothetical protein
VSERKATHQKHLSHVTQAQFVAESPQHRKQDDIGGEFEMVKRRASSLIENAVTIWTEERRITEFGFLCSFPGVNCGAIGAVH